MLGRYSVNIRKLGSRVAFVRNASSEEMKNYREANLFEQADRQSINILMKDGRSFPPGTSMLPLYNLNTAEYFPIVKGTTLDGKAVEVPDSYKAGVKLVSFSFQNYGFNLLPSWLEPFHKKYPQDGPSSPVKSIQVCYFKYKFLSYVKGMFISTMKSKIDPSLHDQTVLTFGDIWVSTLDCFIDSLEIYSQSIAEFLLLPSVFTNYVYLLDRNNKIRWKGSGRADPNELAVLFEHVDKLLQEPHL